MSGILIASCVALVISLIGLAWTIILLRKTLMSRAVHTETEQRGARRSAVLHDSVLDAARRAAEASREAAEELKELRESSNLSVESETEVYSHWGHVIDAGKSIRSIRDRAISTSYDDGHDYASVGPWAALQSGLMDLYRDDQSVSSGVRASVHRDHDLVTRPKGGVSRAVSVKKSSLASKYESIAGKKSSVLEEQLLSDLTRKSVSDLFPLDSRITVVSSGGVPVSVSHPYYPLKHRFSYNLLDGSKPFVTLVSEDDHSLSQKEAPSADSSS